jgi:hypothetical protein
MEVGLGLQFPRLAFSFLYLLSTFLPSLEPLCINSLMFGVDRFNIYLVRSIVGAFALFFFGAFIFGETQRFFDAIAFGCMRDFVPSET